MKTWPALPTLQGYQVAWLGPDVLAGLTLVAIAVPEQMATARLAGMPAVAGLYAFVAGSLVFALIGRSRQMSVGADSTIAPIIASGVAAVVVVGSPQYTHAVSFLALMVGVLVLVVGLLRLGWISELFSTPVITGVLAGIAVEIVVRQLPAILGVAGGGSSTISRVRYVIDQLGHTNGWSVGIAVVVFGLIVVAEQLDHRIPGALIGLVASIIVVAAVGLIAHGVQVVGSVHGGLPSFALPSITLAGARHLLVPAFTIAFIVIAQTAATVRSSSAGAPATQDFNVDLVAIGAGSVVAGVSGSFAVNSSPPRTAIVTASGGRSQVTSIVAAAVVLGVVLLATGLLKDLPKATLGAILVFVATRLFRVSVLRHILAFSRWEFGVALFTGLMVALVGIEQGVVVAMVLSLADRTRRAARPADSVLGREVGTDHWIPTDIGLVTEQVPGVVVYLIYGPIWYGNADYLRLRIPTLIKETAGAVHGLVLDANGMSDIDYTGAQALGALVAELKSAGVTTIIARSSHLVHHDLKRGGLLAIFGSKGLCGSVEEAVEALTQSPA
ncbi:MAG: SulP family inorganic anion transporter [Acidimicrobiales bacterium]